MTETRIRTHWENPWRHNAVPIPIEALADLMAEEPVMDWETRVVTITDRQWWLDHWGQNGRTRIDAYLLWNGKADRVQCGVRWGAEGHEYFSPYIRLTRQKAARLLWESFGGKS